MQGNNEGSIWVYQWELGTYCEETSPFAIYVEGNVFCEDCIQTVGLGIINPYEENVLKNGIVVLVSY